jgi:hypothetical protein
MDWMLTGLSVFLVIYIFVLVKYVRSMEKTITKKNIK